MDKLEKLRVVEVDAARVTGQNQKEALRCVSAARAALLLRSGHQRHLAQAARECGFQYVRFHGLFQDDMGVYREDGEGRPVYSWQYVDEVYDFLLENRLRPFVVFDFMPAALASGSTTVYWERANVTPPGSYKKWGALVAETVRHFTRRYGRREVEKWYFEVWNEPDNPPFFVGNMEDYLRLYEVTARAVKAVDAAYRVGGPAVAGEVDWIRRLIQFSVEREVPLDFISAHSYAAKAFREEQDPVPVPGMPTWKPGPSWPLGNLCYDPCGLEQAVKAVKAAVEASPKPSLEIHFTEWGLTYDYWDPLRDSYHAASYILSRLHAVEDMVQSISYCEASDVFEEDGPPTQAFHGGFGLVNLQGIRKPAYFAYRYLAQLGRERLAANDSDSIACKDRQGVQILTWNSAVRQEGENKAYYCREQPALPAGRLRVVVKGMEPGRYLLQVYAVGYQKNDAYTLYQWMRRPDSLSKGQVELLNGFAGDAPLQVRLLEAEENEALMLPDLDEHENDVFLLKLTKLDG